MQRTYQEKIVKMSILPWRHKWLLLRIFSTKLHFLIFTEYVQCACTAGANPSGETEPACSMAVSLCPSTSQGEGNMTQSSEVFPLLTPGWGSWIPMCLGCGWVKNTSLVLIPLLGFVQIGSSWIHSLSGSRKLLLWSHKRQTLPSWSMLY